MDIVLAGIDSFAAAYWMMLWCTAPPVSTGYGVVAHPAGRPDHSPPKVHLGQGGGAVPWPCAWSGCDLAAEGQGAGGAGLPKAPDQKDVRLFLGPVSWYGRFVPDMARRQIVPLSDLTWKLGSSQVQWGEKQE